MSTIESQCSREAALFHKNCLICSFLLLTPRPNSAAAAEGGIFHRVMVFYALVTS